MSDKLNEQDPLQMAVVCNAADDALEESRRLCSSLAQISVVGIFRTDAQGNYSYVNEGWCRIAGLTPEKALGGSWAQALHPDDRERVDQAWYAATQARQPFIVECRFQRPDGETRWVLGQAEPERDAADEVVGYVGIIADITQSRRYEEDLKKMEIEKNIILDNTDEIIAYHDTNRCIQWANRAYLKSTGLSLPEMRGRKCYEAWGLDGLCNLCPVAVSIETGEPVDAELTPQNQPNWPANQGSWEVSATPVRDNTGHIIGVIEIARNITKRKQAEAEIAKQLDELRRFNAILVDREMRIIEVKHEVNELLRETGLPPRYPSAELDKTGS